MKPKKRLDKAQATRAQQCGKLQKGGNIRSSIHSMMS
jgi:hypothetical protein